MTDQGPGGSGGGSKVKQEIDKAMQSVEQVIQDAEKFFTDVQNTVDEYLKRLQGEDRSRIAKLIVWLFVFACLGTLIFVAFASFKAVADGTTAKWADGAEMMITVLSSVILPVVTLVIGYYFGAETKQK